MGEGEGGGGQLMGHRQELEVDIFSLDHDLWHILVHLIFPS